MASTLPGEYFTDPKRFDREVEALWGGMWFCAGRAPELAHPGDYFLRDIGSDSVIVTRGYDGSLRAFHNVCRHRGTRLCDTDAGRLPGGRIMCPYHSWTYGLDGQLTGAPHMHDTGFAAAEHGLHPVACETWDGHVFLHLGQEPPPLSAQLDGLPERFAAWRMSDLRLHRRIVYDVRANWKLIVQNYNECLHCPVVHPSLNRLTDYLGAENQLPSDSCVGGSMGFRDGAETMSTDGVRRRDYLPGLSPRQRQMVCYWAVFPNLLLSLHPDYMMLHRLWPTAVDRTRIECEFHFHPAEMAKSDFVFHDAVEFWDMTNQEDWRVTELSQKGIQSRAYRPGPYMSREELLFAFDTWVRRRVPEA